MAKTRKEKNEYQYSWREKNREEYLAKRRKNRALRKDELNKKENARRKKPEVLAKLRIHNRKYYRKSHEKQIPMRQAHKMVMYAIKLGIMQRSTVCEKCLKIAKVEGHHEDYSKPLDVIWMCRDCHANLHNRKYKDDNLHGPRS